MVIPMVSKQIICNQSSSNHNRHSILERLLSCCGGDSSLLNIQNKDGETPLSVAVGAGGEVAVKLLLEFGATVNL
jgi:ankyrin repeat protein